MLLGQLMERLEDESDVTVVLEALDDIVLANAVTDAAEHRGLSSAEYAAGAVARFSSAAADDDWLRLMTTLERSDDPARALLAVMLRWAVAEDQKEEAPATCGCGSAHTCG